MPHKKTIKDQRFYLYGYELPSPSDERTLIKVNRHLRLIKERETAKKTA